MCAAQDSQEKKAALLVVDLVGTIKHVQEVFRVAEALIRRGCGATTGSVICQSSNGWDLACSETQARWQKLSGAIKWTEFCMRSCLYIMLHGCGYTVVKTGLSRHANAGESLGMLFPG